MSLPRRPWPRRERGLEAASARSVTWLGPTRPRRGGSSFAVFPSPHPRHTDQNRESGRPGRESPHRRGRNARPDASPEAVRF